MSAGSARSPSVDATVPEEVRPHAAPPANVANAENAIKHFAYYREDTVGLMKESGLTSYLVLLSICHTCRYKGVSFLKFLLSRETDIDVFREGRGKKAVPAIELYPEGSESDRPSRKRLGMEASGRKS